MSIDTKAIISKNVDLVELVAHMKQKYTNVVLHSQNSYSDGTSVFTLVFEDGKDKRNMFIYSTGNNSENEINGIHLSLGMWGNSIDIMKYILNVFGGYLDENDCDDIGFLPYNQEKFVNHTQSPRELFKLKVITMLGIDNLSKVMILCNEYKELEG